MNFPISGATCVSSYELIIFIPAYYNFFSQFTEKQVHLILKHLSMAIYWTLKLIWFQYFLLVIKDFQLKLLAMLKYWYWNNRCRYSMFSLENPKKSLLFEYYSLHFYYILNNKLIFSFNFEYLMVGKKLFL